MHFYECICTSFGSVPRNYGGVYVGLPADLTTVASSQSKSSRKGKPASPQIVFSQSLSSCCDHTKTDANEWRHMHNIFFQALMGLRRQPLEKLQYGYSV